MDVVMNRHGEVLVVDDSGRERERYSLVYGAHLEVKEGDRIQHAALLAECDPYAIPILTETSGAVKFGDIIERIGSPKRFPWEGRAACGGQ